ncbi:MAG: ThiF family adenylyltransferase, partial [Fuerstiella sp.]
AFQPVEVLDWTTTETRAGDLLEHIRSAVGPEAVIEVNCDLLESLTCPTCGTTEPKLSSLGRVKESEGRCGQCGEHRTPNVYHTIGDRAELLDHTLSELGVPLWDILGGRNGMKQSFFEFGGDRKSVLGSLA